MMNQGLTPDEIAENFILPESLGSEWYKPRVLWIALTQFEGGL